MIVQEIETRRANRALSTRSIDNDVLQRIMSAAVLAPSCMNNQPWRFIVCTEPDLLAKVKTALSSGNYWAQNAPAIIAVFTDDALDCTLKDGRSYALFDTGMAVMNLQLQAVREGLYVHPVAGFDSAVIRLHLDVPDNYRIVTLIPLGYPGDGTNLNEDHQKREHGDRSRKPLADVVFFNSPMK